METGDAVSGSEALGNGGEGGSAHVWAATKERAARVLRESQGWLRENPRASAFGLYGLGVVMGWALGWATGKEDRGNRQGCAHRFLSRWGQKLKLD